MTLNSVYTKMRTPSHLIGLVETLLREWYVAREERRVRMEAVMAAAAAKKLPPPSNLSLT